MGIFAMAQMSAQDQDRGNTDNLPPNEEYNIDLKLPARLVKLGEGDNSVRYMDLKSKGTLIVHTNRFHDVGSQAQAESELLEIEKRADENCVDVTSSTIPLKVGQAQLVSWRCLDKRKHKGQDKHIVAYFEVESTTYSFDLTHPSRNEKDMNKMFEKLLKSIKPSED